jgi:uncharacterized membrane protein YkoI
MKTPLACGHIVAAIACATLAYAGPQTAARTAPHAVDLSKYPPAVRATIESETRNATIKHVSKETEKGKTNYEVETMVDGKSRDIIIDPTGKVVEVEQQIPLEAAPAAVQDALKSQGKLLKLEAVLRDGVMTYEAAVQTTTGKATEVALDAEGKPIKN